MKEQIAVTGSFERYVLGRELDVRILTTGDDTEGRYDMVDAFQLPNTATPLHLHTRYEERLAVIEGSCTVWFGEDEMHLSAGDFIAIARNVPHAIKAGPRGCRSYLTTSPAAFAELIRRTATPSDSAGPDTEPDVALFTTVAMELGDHILGPPGMVPADLQ
jgi:quercetin dioxygenase-like cupin family protein